MNYKIINFEDECYPEKLRNIRKPPKRLYVIGNIELLKKDMIAVVGSRKISNYGKKVGGYFCRELALRGIPIISGMAVGSDTLAHNSAIKYGAPTIAVLGTGLNHIYPKENIELYEKILEHNGLIITEVELEEKYNSRSFPNRNRIISGLAEGILVIEAAYRSGTGITVRYAKEQEKKVFAIPNSLENKNGVGINKFLKQGASLVTDVDDILECFPQFLNKKRKSNNEINIKEEYIPIYNILKNKNCGIDEIAKKLNKKDIVEITNILAMMELEDLIIRDIGIGYKIKEENA